MRKELSKNEYLQLEGLLSLAKKHYDDLKGVESAAEALLDVEDADCHCSEIGDAIYGRENFSAKKFCKDYEIKILKR